MRISHSGASLMLYSSQGDESGQCCVSGKHSKGRGKKRRVSNSFGHKIHITYLVFLLLIILFWSWQLDGNCTTKPSLQLLLDAQGKQGQGISPSGSVIALQEKLLHDSGTLASIKIDFLSYGFDKRGKAKKK